MTPLSFSKYPKTYSPHSRFQYSEVLIFHGELVQLFSSSKDVACGHIKDFNDMLKKSTRTLILLAAPFAYTLVRTSIPLKANELAIADLQTLEFSRFAQENRLLESIHLDSQLGITTFSHISDLGSDLLLQLKKAKTRLRWKPAISFIINQQINYSLPHDTEFPSLSFAFEQELLHTLWKSKIPKFRHIYYWQQDIPFPIAAKQAEHLLGNGHHQIPSLHIRFPELGPQASKSIEILSQLFFPTIKSRQLKSKTKQIRPNKHIRFRKIPPRFILAAITVVLLFWSILLEHKLYSLKEQRAYYQEAVKQLLPYSEGLEELAKREQALMKVTSMIDALQKNRIVPAEILEQLETQLPKSAWIQSVVIDAQKIDLQILDAGETQVTRTIENLNRNYPEVSLKENTTSRLKDIILKKQTITINTNGFSHADQPVVQE